MAISKVILNGTTQMDVTGVTAGASQVLSGYTIIGADGELVTGTATSGGGGSVTLQSKSATPTESQ